MAIDPHLNFSPWKCALSSPCGNVWMCTVVERPNFAADVTSHLSSREWCDGSQRTFARSPLGTGNPGEEEIEEAVRRFACFQAWRRQVHAKNWISDWQKQDWAYIRKEKDGFGNSLWFSKLAWLKISAILFILFNPFSFNTVSHPKAHPREQDNNET